jgi:hypothetical protein
VDYPSEQSQSVEAPSGEGARAAGQPPVSPQRVEGALRAWNMARRWLADQWTGNDQSAESPSWALIVGWAATVAVLVVLILHVIQAAGLATGSAALAALPVGVAVIVAAGCWSMLLRLLWRTSFDPNQPGYALAVVFSIVAICAGLESFAGLSTLLWQHGVIRPSVPGSPSLWRCEGHYLWNVLGSVPLLAVSQTLGWRDPQPFADHISGTLLLAFKIAIIAPLVHLGLSGYQGLEARRTRAIDNRERKEDARAAAQWAEGIAGVKNLEKLADVPMPARWFSRTRPLMVWDLFARLLMTLIAAVALAAVLFDPESPVNRWLNGPLSRGVSIATIHLPLAWLQTAPQWLVLAGLIAAIWFAVSHLGLRYATPDRVRTLAGAIGAVLVYFWLLALLTLTFAAGSLALLHVGAAVARPAIPPGSQLLAGVDAYAWEMANSLPGPNIPATLNWSLRYRFTGDWSNALLLLYKIGFLAVLLFPLYRIIRVYTTACKPADPKPSLPAAGQFLDLLKAAGEALEQVSSGAGTEPGPSASPGPGTDGGRVTRHSYGPVITAFGEATRRIDKLEPALDKVQALFGRGVVADMATAAEAAARNWHKESFIALPPGFLYTPAGRRYRRYFETRIGGRYLFGPRQQPSDLAGLGKTLNYSISEYSRSANQALQNAAVPSRSADQLARK